MTNIGIQISSVKKYLQTTADVLDSFKKCSKIGYKYIQIQWISASVPNEAIRDALLESGLECVGTQESYKEVFPNIEKYIKMNQMWGGKYICSSATGMENTFSSVDECLNAAEQFNKMAERIKGEGLIFAFHPHNSHIVEIDGRTSLDIIMENTSDDVQLNLDMYHIKTSGNDPVEWLGKSAGRADMTHFKDYKAEGSKTILCPVGQGVIEWTDIFKACGKTGVKYCFAEQEEWGKDAFECLEESYQYIKANL
ncbi:MAG: sugar phosphate isomerase/epimerase [Oscillospiraceae bacterium]|nr:sugar phosphate isomerase/epimerase [Oscillospiraceae bacterium]